MTTALYNLSDHINGWYGFRMSIIDKATTEKGRTPYDAVSLNVKVKVIIGHR